MTSYRRQLIGSIKVTLPPEQAFHLFTPRGERAWVDGWNPRFPAATTDDTEPGTVFETDANGKHTVWVVVDRQPGRRISYARTTVGDRAGTVTVAFRAGPGDHSTVTVTYDLTALTDAARAELDEFADAYPDFLRSWQDAIAAVDPRLLP